MATQTAPVRTRRAKMPGQLRLLAASLMILLGAFIPWLYTPFGVINGSRGPGWWTATAAMLALAGALVPAPLRLLAVLQAVLTAAVCMAIPVWQLVHTFSLVGLTRWMPGPGLLLTFVGGILCAVAAWQLWSVRPAEAA